MNTCPSHNPCMIFSWPVSVYIFKYFIFFFSRGITDVYLSLRNVYHLPLNPIVPNWLTREIMLFERPTIGYGGRYRVKQYFHLHIYSKIQLRLKNTYINKNIIIVYLIHNSPLNVINNSYIL